MKTTYTHTHTHMLLMRNIEDTFTHTACEVVPCVCACAKMGHDGPPPFDDIPYYTATGHY